MAFIAGGVLTNSVALAEDEFFDTKVQKVLSGDRIMLQGGTIVHYYGIEVPSLSDSRAELATLAKAALETNERLVKDKIIRVEFVDVDDTSSIRRAYVFASGEFINGYLIKNGYALMAGNYGEKEKYYTYFATVQGIARSLKKGLWGIS
jgi:endonuclease YncB( thermonuclease family)